MGLFSRHRSSSTTQQPPNHDIYVFIRTPDITSTDTIWSLAVSQKPRAQSFPLQPPPQDPRLNRKKSILSFGTSRRQSKAIQISYSEPQSPTYVPEPSKDLIEFNHISGDLHVTTHKSQHRVLDTIISEDDEPSDPDSVLLKIQLPTSTSPHHSSLPLPLQIEQALHRLSSYTAQHIHHHTPQTSPTESWLKLALTALQHERYLPPATNGFNVERFMDFARNSLTSFEGDLLQSQSSEEGRAALAAAAMGFGRSMEMDLARHVKVVDYAKHVEEEERVARLFGGVDERLARTARMQRRKERDATGGEGKRAVGVEGVDGNGWVIGRPEMRREWEEGGEVWDLGYERPVNPYAGFV